MVRERPIETILSGPAASIVGARWLTGASDALVSDIGGTTTDVALLRGGLPEIERRFAHLGLVVANVVHDLRERAMKSVLELDA